MLVSTNKISLLKTFLLRKIKYWNINVCCYFYGIYFCRVGLSLFFYLRMKCFFVLLCFLFFSFDQVVGIKWSVTVCTHSSDYFTLNISEKIFLPSLYLFIYFFWFYLIFFFLFFFFCFFVYHDCSPERKSLVTHIIFFFNMRMNSSYMPLLYSPYCWPIQYKCGR